MLLVRQVALKLQMEEMVVLHLSDHIALQLVVKVEEVVQVIKLKHCLVLVQVVI